MLSQVRAHQLNLCTNFMDTGLQVNGGTPIHVVCKCPSSDTCLAMFSEWSHSRRPLKALPCIIRGTARSHKPTDKRGSKTWELCEHKNRKFHEPLSERRSHLGGFTLFGIACRPPMQASFSVACALTATRSSSTSQHQHQVAPLVRTTLGPFEIPPPQKKKLWMCAVLPGLLHSFIRSRQSFPMHTAW